MGMTNRPFPHILQVSKAQHLHMYLLSQPESVLSYHLLLSVSKATFTVAFWKWNNLGQGMQGEGTFTGPSAPHTQQALTRSSLQLHILDNIRFQSNAPHRLLESACQELIEKLKILSRECVS